jgi:hypothetical protein
MHNHNSNFVNIKKSTSRFRLLLIITASILQGCENKCDETKMYGSSSILTSLNFSSAFRFNQFTGLHETLDFNSIKMADSGDTITFVLSTSYRLDYETKKQCDYQEGYRYFCLTGNRFKIETIGDFDSIHPDGSDISEYFLYDYIYTVDQNGFTNNISLNKYIRQYGLCVNSNVTPTYYIRLIKKPTSRNLQFRIYNYSNTTSDGIADISPTMQFN